MSEAPSSLSGRIIVIEASMALAQRLGTTLASFDGQLNRVARAIGVSLFAETCLCFA